MADFSTKVRDFPAETAKTRTHFLQIKITDILIHETMVYAAYQTQF